jgi:hypothetical protein
MPGVRNIGATGSLRRTPDDDADFATVWLRLFARTDDGEQVDDPEEHSAEVRLERSKLAAVELSVQMKLRLRQPPAGPRREPWERIAAELAERGIEAGPDDLHVLRFEFVPDDRLRKAMTETWPDAPARPPSPAA